MKQIILIVVACLHVSVAGAQAKNRTQISGVITDMQTGQPLAGAYITISDTKAGTISDSTGAYLLKNVPVGHTIIEVSFYGYRTIVEHIDITGDVVRNFALSSAIIINEGITITGVAGATSIRRAPISISRVDKGTLLATSSTNIIDALSRQPGVSQLTTGPAISKPVIRGLGYNRLVVINDGIRQEGQQWGDEHGIEIDENSVSRVEVLRGPASIIYGSDAIAGVINIITTTPLPDGTLRGNILSSYQTNHRQRSLFANLGGNSQGFNWNIWGDYKAAADYKNRYDGRVFNSKFNEKNFGGYAGYNGAWGFTHFIVSRFNQRVGVIEGERDAVSGRFIKLLPGGQEAEATDDDFKSITPGVPYQHVQHLKIIT
ncbi:MAG TPA: TonB-dependent receptor plug domain-containing protein, partial [Flavisolibacter sp.]